MKVRSLGLAACGLALLIAAAVLGAILVHDGEAEAADLGAVAPGETVEVKGEPEPFFPDSLAAWAPLRPLFANHTYQLAPQDGIVVLLTSEDAMPTDTVLAEGMVAFVGPMPGDAEHLVVLLQVSHWREPLLFH